MELKKFDSQDELVEQIVKIVSDIISKKPDAVLCFACGETPRPVMDKLFEVRKNGEIDFSRVRLLGLDEWIGVGRGTVGSCSQMLYDDFFSPMKFRTDQINIFDGLSKNLDVDIKNINQIVEELGIDFVLLGIGMNGHIGLNEPGFNPDEKAHVVELSDMTKKVMAKYFDQKINLQQGITLGFSQLLSAQKIILMATGERKAKIVKEIINSEPNNSLPASMFKQSEHESFFFIDEAAGAKL